MNWKQFKTWLDKNIIKSEGLTVKIRTEKQDVYGELSTTVLTAFCDSLEATLDNKNDHHLFPEFSQDKSFKELFVQESSYFGKRTNQKLLSENDYSLLEKLFQEWKATELNKDDNNKDRASDANSNSNKISVRNILLIGRTGSGKSTLANVLMGKEGNKKFIESSRSTSVTKQIEEGMVEVNISKDGSEKVIYRVIDTIGIGDTELTPRGVLIRLAEVADRVKKEGLNQILFVTKGRFTKEEVETYDLLSSIIFDKKVLNYTTIVRTDFTEFEDEEACKDDRASLRKENADLAHILSIVNIVYVDNPPLKGRNAKANEEIREESREKLLDYLMLSCRGNYRPDNIDTLDERVDKYKTDEQKLKEKLKELEKDREKIAKEFNEKIANMKEEQAQELRENRIRFQEDLHKAKVESDEKLRKTVNDLEDDQKKKRDEMEQKNKEQLRQSEERAKQEINNLKNDQERQNKAHQEDLRRQREEADRLREDLNKKNDNADIFKIMKEMREGPYTRR